MIIEADGTVQRVLVEGKGSGYLRGALMFLLGARGTARGFEVVRGSPEGPMGSPKSARFVIDPSGSGIAFPAPVPLEALALMIESWLAEMKYPPAPDTDGSVCRGWRVMGPGVSSVDYFAGGAVEPCWMVYGK